jgi:hypothetical protein
MNEKILTLLRKSGFQELTFDNEIFLEKFAQLVAEECAGVCEGIGTDVAGWDGGVPTAVANVCVDRIRKDFGIK